IAHPSELHGLGVSWVSDAPQAPAPPTTVTWVPDAPAPSAPAPAPPLSEEAASFRAVMRQRYDMPDEMFDAMFGGNTPVYRGFVPTIPSPQPSSVPAADESAEEDAGSEDSGFA